MIGRKQPLRWFRKHAYFWSVGSGHKPLIRANEEALSQVWSKPRKTAAHRKAKKRKERRERQQYDNEGGMELDA